MAQLNPNFEIDFNDINSYEQIQLIQDTQLAKENLLMHKAYKEPAEDEIIRNQFSSFTFVDFCPKLFTIGGQQRQSPNSPTSDQDEQRRSAGSRLLRHQNYELETFSDLFDRINAWLRLNKDWRVVSMETLVFDCTSQFNHLKSSIHASVLPRNMRGLRLYLSPSKSCFAGPQKVGCINVIPRKLTGQYHAGVASSDNSNEPLSYETLDQILHRLNELLLTRPIEGRILSVETITLPMVNGYVNTETNYFMDSRLRLLEQDIYTHASVGPNETQPANAQGLADVLRVYYEFGPLVCGLVNLLDFLPHFHRQSVTNANQTDGEPDAAGDEQKPMEIDASETLTRLVRRSLAWFEEERKLVLQQTSANQNVATGRHRRRRGRRQPAVNLKLCNLQIVGKILLKSQLAAVRMENAHELIQTRRMFHEKPREPIVCQPCGSSSIDQQADWCAHVHELNQPYKLKFVRLAYVVPVLSKQLAGRLVAFQRPQVNPSQEATKSDDDEDEEEGELDDEEEEDEDEDEDEDEVEQIGEMRDEVADYSSPESISQAEAPDERLVQEQEQELDLERQTSDSSSSSSSSQAEELADDLHLLESLLEAGGEPDLACGASLALVSETNARQRAHQLAHQQGDEADELQPADGPSSGQLIGQLTYRLFAPCQLVNSSSCFSINPVNSSCPLSRRGSVNLNAASSLSSENAAPSALLLLPSSQQQQSQQQQQQQQLQAVNSLSDSSASINQLTGGQSAGALATAVGAPAFSQQQVISFGAFFPALSHDIIASTSAPFQLMAGAGDNSARPTTGAFTTNEFEPVDAIRRRMEIYVTTNSMKVLAGETLVVGLSDQLSCLSTAIEQTIVRLSLSASAPASTWVSVYMLYAAVAEPNLPGQLLEQQRLRDRLELIQESDESACQQNEHNAHTDQNHQVHKEVAPGGADNLMPVFDDDFKSAEPVVKLASRVERASISEPSPPPPSAPTPTPTPMSPTPSRRSLYNSAYDRTVALPTQPDDHLGEYLEPVDFKLNPQQLADRLGFEDDQEAVEIFYGGAGGCQHKPLSLTNVSVQAAQRQMRQRLRQRKAGAAIIGGNRQLRLVKPAGSKGKRRQGRADGAQHHHCSLI